MIWCGTDKKKKEANKIKYEKTLNPKREREKKLGGQKIFWNATKNCYYDF